MREFWSLWHFVASGSTVLEYRVLGSLGFALTQKPQTLSPIEDSQGIQFVPALT